MFPRNSEPGSKNHRSLLALLLGFAGLVVLIGVLLFAVFSGIFQQSPPQQANQHQTGQPGTATSGPSSTFPAGTVQPSKSGPYGFTILKNFTPHTINYLKQLGITWVRYQLNWKLIEPQQGQFNWSELDAAVNLANSNGLHLTFPLQLAPDWALSQQSCTGTPLLPGSKEMADFATAVAQRYNGQNQHGYIDSYEIGNEEFDDHLPRNLEATAACPQVNFVSLYGPVLKAGYQAIKAQSPNALVGMFGLWWVNTPHIYKYMDWLYSHGYSSYFDYANFHYYVCSSNNNDPSVSVGNRPSFDEEWKTIHSVMAQYGDANKPIWVTEIGWTISGVNQSQKCIVSQQTQAQYMSYVLNAAANSHVIQHLFWYTIDMNNDGMSITQFNDKLPSYFTLQTFIQQNPAWK